MEDHSPLRVALFLDGRPGHEKQTRGVLAALQGLTPLEVREYVVPGGSPVFRVGSRLKWGVTLGGRLAGRKNGDGADLILGTGSAVHAPMLLYRKRAGGRAVTCMTPDYPFSRLMDLCIVPEHDQPGKADNVFTTLGPPAAAARADDHDPDRGLVLVGGRDRKSHVWDDALVTDQVVKAVRSAPRVKWSVTTSPRTPARTTALLERAVAGEKNAMLFPFSRTPPGWVEERYAKSAWCWVTADSVSMLFEALSAGCRAGIIPVEWKNPESRVARAVDSVLARGLALDFERRAELVKSSFSPPALNEAERAAREILARWWPGRLP
ncbi:MAG: mitochondrial fission ELM1 family protein [Deltaproteobacteria bacterium]|nr:mitochondrial fission ELM1 family protein [Deltaproteobacteria bacterium]